MKSSLPENPNMKPTECQETESLHKWSVEKQLVCRDTSNVKADECDDRSGWDDTRTLIEVKTGEVKEPIERRESC